jgi:hypothetical protein
MLWLLLTFLLLARSCWGTPKRCLWWGWRASASGVRSVPSRLCAKRSGSVGRSRTIAAMCQRVAGLRWFAILLLRPSVCAPRLRLRRLPVLTVGMTRLAWCWVRRWPSMRIARCRLRTRWLLRLRLLLSLLFRGVAVTLVGAVPPGSTDALAHSNLRSCFRLEARRSCCPRGGGFHQGAAVRPQDGADWVAFGLGLLIVVWAVWRLYG